MNKAIVYRFLQFADADSGTILKDLGRLLSQLAGKNIELSHDWFLEVIHKSMLRVAVEESTEIIVAMAVFMPQHAPSSKSARINDVVVAQGYAGQGIDGELVTQLCKYAAHKGYTSIVIDTELAKQIYKNTDGVSVETSCVLELQP